MKVLVIDNYDSFTFNIVQYLGKLKCNALVRRNDQINVQEINKLNPDKILISPGPGKPEESKISLTVIKEFGQHIPVLGVCLGHQAIAVVFGGKVIKAKQLVHGKTSIIKHDNKTIYKNIPQNFIATRYHSLIVDKKSLPKELTVSSYSKDGLIMGLRHKNLPIEGIQFHPESILTDVGFKLLQNWMNL